MTTLEIWLLAVSLAIDCFTVSVTSGIILRRIQWPTFLKMAFFFGTELTGLSDLVIGQADEFVKIPMYGFTESLNVSVCAAITMYSVTRRLRGGKPFQASHRSVRPLDRFRTAGFLRYPHDTRTFQGQ